MPGSPPSTGPARTPALQYDADSNACACEGNTYWDGSACTSCGAGKHSAPGSVGASACTACTATYGASCTACNDTACTDCGSTNYFNNATQQCAACSTDFGASCNACSEAAGCTTCPTAAGGPFATTCGANSKACCLPACTDAATHRLVGGVGVPVAAMPAALYVAGWRLRVRLASGCYDRACPCCCRG